MPSPDENADLTVTASAAPKLPNMNEFSPGVLEGVTIRQLLSELSPFQGDKAAMSNFIASRFPRIATTADVSQRAGRANNVLIGMSQCGLLEKHDNRITAQLTGLATNILHAASDQGGADLFAGHLIEKCHGHDLIESVRMIRARGDRVSLDEIRSELRSRGFEVTENEGNASKIRQWLEHSGVVDSDWNFDDARLAAVIGVTSPVLAKWSGLTRAQRVFLTQLRELSQCSPLDWIAVRQVKRLCETNYGRSIFPEGRLRADVIEPLGADGWIETRGTGRGRGGDSGDVRALPQLTDIRISLPIDASGGIPADLLDKLGTPLGEIFRDLDSDDTHVKGLALELLALRIIRDIGIYPDGFRVRSNKTGGAEVDLTANAVQLHYSRWLVQCKNTSSVDTSAIAKEAGMALVLGAQVILMVCTGRFKRSVIDFANTLARTSALQAVFIDGQVLAQYRARGGAAVIDWLHENSRQVLLLKREQLHESHD